MWKKNHLSCFLLEITRLHQWQSQPIGIMVKANLDETELLENTGVSDLYQPLELLLTKTMKLPCITRIEFEEENWVQLFLSIDFKLAPTESTLFRVFVFPDQDSFVFAETDRTNNLFQSMMQAKSFNQHSPHYEQFYLQLMRY